MISFSILIFGIITILYVIYSNYLWEGKSTPFIRKSQLSLQYSINTTKPIANKHDSSEKYRFLIRKNVRDSPRLAPQKVVWWNILALIAHITIQVSIKHRLIPRIRNIFNQKENLNIPRCKAALKNQKRPYWRSMNLVC